MGFSIDVSVPALTVFFQGLISFFSPCVLPLIPLYIGYLSGGTGKKDQEGRIIYEKKKVMIHTLFFVFGVSFAFFVLGLGVSALGGFFKGNQMIFARIGGILVFLFGLYQLGVLGSSRILGREIRLPLKLDPLAMSPVTALFMGFTFSFSWTPCVGPALASVLLMTASAKSKAYGFLLIGVYTLGFVLPFLAVGLFTTSLLQFFKKHNQVVKYTVKAGGVLMVLMGVLMFTGTMNDVTGYLSDISFKEEWKEERKGESGQNGGGDGQNQGAGTGTGSEKGSASGENETGAEGASGESAGSGAEGASGESAGNGAEGASGETAGDAREDKIKAIDFTLEDQYGVTHSLEDYAGKTIFLNFWGTWCPPCRAEMPEIQKLYETYDKEGEDAVIILGVAAPNLGQETDQEGIADFLEENGYTYPVLMDADWELFGAYGISSYPTTFMIDRDGNVFGYVTGQLDEDIMKSIIQQTLDGVRY